MHLRRYYEANAIFPKLILSAAVRGMKYGPCFQQTYFRRTTGFTQGRGQEKGLAGPDSGPAFENNGVITRALRTISRFDATPELVLGRPFDHKIPLGSGLSVRCIPSHRQAGRNVRSAVRVSGAPGRSLCRGYFSMCGGAGASRRPLAGSQELVVLDTPSPNGARRSVMNVQCGYLLLPTIE